MGVVNGYAHYYGTTLALSSPIDPETPVDSRKSLHLGEIACAGVKLGLGPRGPSGAHPALGERVASPVVPSITRLLSPSYRIQHLLTKS